MAVINLNNLRCTPVKILYQYLINKAYGVDCNPAYTEAKAFEAYKDYWAYTVSTDCPIPCDVEKIIRKSNYGCVDTVLCEDEELNCNIAVNVDTPTYPCTTINVNIE